MATPKTATCSVRLLPPEKRAVASERAIEINPSNAPGAHNPLLAFAPFSKEQLAVLVKKYWGKQGVKLTVGFLDAATTELKAKILNHMNAWNTDAHANVSFVETGTDPQVRIAFTPGDGYWSYLGTDILSISAEQPTMNLDSFSMSTPDSEFYRVVRHETGHTLGFPHEHTRSEIVNNIDQDRAIAYFMADQGWSKEQVIAQVLTPLDSSALMATAEADPNSIMCYWLPASIMKDNKAVTGGTDIDASDAKFAASLYPQPA